MAAEGLPVEVSTRVCGVSVSGFYEWRSRAPSERAIRHAWLTDQIIDVHAASRGTYGSRRVHAELTLGRGVEVGYHAVTMLMARAGIQGLPGSRRRRKATGGPTALDLVDRNFARSDPDQLWVTDITEHPTREGKVYCCVVLDACSRRVVGWSIDSAQTSTLVTNALGMAISNRQPVAGSGLIIHSDQGVQGGFNRSSQHLTMMEVAGGSTTAVGGQGASAGDAVAGSADPGASCGARVLASDRSREEHRGRRRRCRRVGPRRVALVSSRWRHGASEPC